MLTELRSPSVTPSSPARLAALKPPGELADQPSPASRYPHHPGSSTSRAARPHQQKKLELHVSPANKQTARTVVVRSIRPPPARYNMQPHALPEQRGLNVDAPAFDPARPRMQRRNSVAATNPSFTPLRPKRRNSMKTVRPATTGAWGKALPAETPAPRKEEDPTKRMLADKRKQATSFADEGFANKSEAMKAAARKFAAQRAALARSARFEEIKAAAEKNGTAAKPVLGEAGQVKGVEVPAKKKVGAEVKVETEKKPVLGETGQVNGADEATQKAADAAAQKAARKAARKSAKKLARANSTKKEKSTRKLKPADKIVDKENAGADAAPEVRKSSKASVAKKISVQAQATDADALAQIIEAAATVAPTKPVDVKSKGLDVKPAKAEEKKVEAGVAEAKAAKADEKMLEVSDADAKAKKAEAKAKKAAAKKKLAEAKAKAEANMKKSRTPVNPTENKAAEQTEKKIDSSAVAAVKDSAAKNEVPEPTTIVAKAASIEKQDTLAEKSTAAPISESAEKKKASPSVITVVKTDTKTKTTSSKVTVSDAGSSVTNSETNSPENKPQTTCIESNATPKVITLAQFAPSPAKKKTSEPKAAMSVTPLTIPASQPTMSQCTSALSDIGADEFHTPTKPRLTLASMPSAVITPSCMSAITGSTATGSCVTGPPSATQAESSAAVADTALGQGKFCQDCAGVGLHISALLAELAQQRAEPKKRAPEPKPAANGWKRRLSQAVIGDLGASKAEAEAKRLQLQVDVLSTTVAFLHEKLRAANRAGADVEAAVNRCCIRR